MFIDILDDGMVEIYSEIDGKKERMTEEEYERWSKRFLKSGETTHFDVNIGEWKDDVVIIDDIPFNNEQLDT